MEVVAFDGFSRLEYLDAPRGMGRGDAHSMMLKTRLWHANLFLAEKFSLAMSFNSACS